MQKIKFDFEATKQLIYAPNSTAQIGAPVDADGNVANDGTAIGIVLCRRNESNKYWVKQNLVVMVAGYCDIIDAQAIWGDEYSEEAMAAMSDITFCDNHELPTGGGGGGADVVIKATYDDFGRNPVATLVAGSFNDLATKLSSFVPVTVHLVCETKDEDMGESYCLNVPCRVVATGDYSDITNISFITIVPWMENIAVCVPITTITFNSDNTVQAFTN